MPLSSPDQERQLRHTRTITVAAYVRADGQWDLDAHITDIKAQDAYYTTGIRPAGRAIHDLWLRITIDSNFTITQAEAAADDMPFPGHCTEVHPAYKQMIGMSLMRGFRHNLQECLGGVLGCTHLTELALVLPTAAIQAMAGDKKAQEKMAEPNSKRPFHIDRCYAMRVDGAAVAQFYPRWAVKPPTGS